MARIVSVLGIPFVPTLFFVCVGLDWILIVFIQSFDQARDLCTLHLELVGQLLTHLERCLQLP